MTSILETLAEQLSRYTGTKFEVLLGRNPPAPGAVGQGRRRYILRATRDGREHNLGSGRRYTGPELRQWLTTVCDLIQMGYIPTDRADSLFLDSGKTYDYSVNYLKAEFPAGWHFKTVHGHRLIFSDMNGNVLSHSLENGTAPVGTWKVYSCPPPEPKKEMIPLSPRLRTARYHSVSSFLNPLIIDPDLSDITKGQMIEEAINCLQEALENYPDEDGNKREEF